MNTTLTAPQTLADRYHENATDVAPCPRPHCDELARIFDLIDYEDVVCTAGHRTRYSV